MIQFLKFDTSLEKDLSFNIISGSESVKFFLKKALYLFLFFYSTIFLAVAIPFVKTPFIPIYFVGSLVTSIFFIRLANHIIKYIKYKNGKIRLNAKGIEVIDSKKKLNIEKSSITYMEYNILGNLIIREKYAKTSFPVTLLKEEDRETLLNLFIDMSPKRTRLFKKIWEFVDAIVVALVLAVHIIRYIVQAYYIPTGSMEDTLLVKDHLFVEKITYGPVIPQMIGMEKPIHLDWLGIRKVNRNDIVIFKPPHDPDKDYIKRCIAVPGDKLEIKEGAVYVNDKKLTEPYTKGLTFDDNGKSKVQGIIPPGKVVVFGDNRENSLDSRYFGYLDIERISGKAFILYWNTDQLLEFDFSRFGLIR